MIVSLVKHLAVVAAVSAVSIMAGYAILDENSGLSEAALFARYAAMAVASGLVLLIPLLVRSARRATALLLARGLMMILGFTPWLVGVFFCYYLEMREFLLSLSFLLAGSFALIGFNLWAAARDIDQRWTRRSATLVAQHFNADLAALDVTRLTHALGIDAQFRLPPIVPRHAKLAGFAILGMLVLVSRELQHFFLFLVYLAVSVCAASLIWMLLAAWNQLLVARKIRTLEKTLGATIRPMTEAEIASRLSRKNRRKRAR